MKEVAKWLSHNIVTDIVIIIYSDNQTVIRTLEAMSLNSQASIDYRIAHNEIGEQFNIYLICMPVQRNITENYVINSGRYGIY